MKTITPTQALEQKFFLNKKTQVTPFANKEKQILVEYQSTIIESIIEVIIEPIIFKC